MTLSQQPNTPAPADSSFKNKNFSATVVKGNRDIHLSQNISTTGTRPDNGIVLINSDMSKINVAQTISRMCIDDLLLITRVTPPAEWQWMLKNDVSWVKVRVHKERDPLFAPDPVLTKIIWWKPPGIFYNLPSMYIIEPRTVENPRIVRIGEWDAIREICKLCLKIMRKRYLKFQKILRRLKTL